MRTLDFYSVPAFFLFTGVFHFARPSLFLKIMPPWVPCPKAVNAVVGALECVLACLWTVPPAHTPAGWGLLALLLAVFPANVRMATNPAAGLGLKRGWLIARLPLQGVLLYWVWAQIGR